MSEQRCDMQPVFMRCWPGKEPDFVCVEHAAQTRAIAEHMGCHIPLNPVVYDEARECACFVTAEAAAD